jgi:pimeloyl-ACP methyl ester carboxylesterase
VLLSAEDRCAELRELGLPVLVAFGAREPYWEAPVQQDMAERLGAQAVEIPDAGHCAQLDNPSGTAAALLAFLTAADAVAQPAPTPPAAQVLSAALL